MVRLSTNNSLKTHFVIPFFDRVRRFLGFSFLLFPLFAMAQHPSFWVLNHEQGLPSLKVYDLMEDDLGVMWMGTSEGLVHYDGLWLNTLQNDGSFAPDRSMVVQDALGTIWSMNFAGQLFCANYERMWNDTLISPHFTGRIIDIQHEGDSILFLTKKEMILYLPIENSVSVIYKAEKDEKIYGNAWSRYVQTSFGIKALPSGKVVQATGGPTYSLNASSSGNHWFYHITGNVKRLTNNGQETIANGLKRKEGPFPRINGVRTTSAGTWILTYDGAYLVEAKRWFFPSEPVSDVLEAKDGATWFSTLTDGVRVIPNLNLRRYGKEPDGLPTERFNRVRKLPNGNLVASDNSGMLVIIHPDKGLVATFHADNSRESEALEIDTTNGRILVAFGDLYLLDMNLNLLDKLSGNVKSISVGLKSLMVVDALNLLDVDYDGTRFGEPVQVEPTKGKAFYRSFHDSENRMWAISSSGVEVNGSPIELERPIRLGISNTENRVFLSDRNDSIAVFNNGKFERWLIIPEKLRQAATVRRLAVSKTQLFVMLSNAVLCLDFQTENWQRCGASEGLPSTDLRDIIFSDGQLWLATFNGLYALLLDQQRPILPPKVLIRRLNVNGVEHSSQEILNLKHNENDLEIQLRGVSTRSRGHINFKYRLGGLMDDFDMNANGSTIRFRALPPGNYSLEVFAVDANGTQSAEPLQLQFSIAKPWYVTWPFYLAMALLLVAIVSVVFLLRIRYIKQQNQQQLQHVKLMEDLRSSQLTALRAQMNPHFMFNVLNSIQGLFTLGKTEKANEVLSRFSDLMRSILDVSDQNTITLDKEMELISLYLELEAVRFGDDFQYKIEVADMIDTKKVEVPSLLIQPYVENAVKHGLLHKKGGKKLSVSLSLLENESMLEVKIDDNGVGREKAGELRSKKHRSFANEASSSRLNLLNVENIHKIGVEIIDKKNEAGEATGTVVFLRIPLR